MANQIKKTPCPYPPSITDEASGQIISNDKYTLWRQGYSACQNDQCDEVESAADKLNAIIAKFNEDKKELKKAYKASKKDTS